MQPEPGLALLPEPIALALDHEGVAVMQESIEDGGGDDVVAEDLTPLRHALPGGRGTGSGLRGPRPTARADPRRQGAGHENRGAGGMKLGGCETDDVLTKLGSCRCR